MTAVLAGLDVEYGYPCRYCGAPPRQSCVNVHGQDVNPHVVRVRTAISEHLRKGKEKPVADTDNLAKKFQVFLAGQDEDEWMRVTAHRMARIAHETAAGEVPLDAISWAKWQFMRPAVDPANQAEKAAAAFILRVAQEDAPS